MGSVDSKLIKSDDNKDKFECKIDALYINGSFKCKYRCARTGKVKYIKVEMKDLDFKSYDEATRIYIIYWLKMKYRIGSIISVNKQKEDQSENIETKCGKEGLSENKLGWEIESKEFINSVKNLPKLHIVKVDNIKSAPHERIYLANFSCYMYYDIKCYGITSWCKSPLYADQIVDDNNKIKPDQAYIIVDDKTYKEITFWF